MKNATFFATDDLSNTKIRSIPFSNEKRTFNSFLIAAVEEAVTRTNYQNVHRGSNDNASKSQWFVQITTAESPFFNQTNNRNVWIQQKETSRNNLQKSCGLIPLDPAAYCSFQNDQRLRP